MRKKLRSLLVLATLVLVAGCGSGPAETGNGNSTAIRAKAVKFSECMRAHGVSSFPDPNASDKVTIDGVVNGSSLDPRAAHATAARPRRTLALRCISVNLVWSGSGLARAA